MARHVRETPARARAASATVDAVAPDTADTTKIKRASFPLTPDGKIDFARMHARTRHELATVLSDPALARELGIDAPATTTKAPVATLPEPVALGVLHALATVEAAILMRATGASRDLVTPIATFTKDEAAAIVPSLQNVLTKYTGAWLEKYGDEFALLTALSTITMTKIAMVRLAMQTPRRAPLSVVPAPDVERAAFDDAKADAL